MQHSSRTVLSLSLSAIALCAALMTGCESSSGGSPTDTTPAVTTPDHDLRTHYENQLAALRDDLLTLKQEHYITHKEYESRIDALEGREPVGEPTPDIPVGNPSPDTTPGDTRPTETKPTDTSPGTTTPSETTPPASDEPVADMSFGYEIVDGHAIIQTYTGERRDVVIPATIAGYPVTVIHDNAFAGTGVETVTLPDTVITVGWFAFYGCTALRWIEVPASVSLIEYGAFDACSGVVFRCPEGSYAAAYAGSFGIRVEMV